jgi:hypothetical protein
VSWNDRFQDPIILRSGIALATLRDAAEYVADRFADFAYADDISYSAELLMAAAVSGAREDISTSHDHLKSALEVRRLLVFDQGWRP